MPPTHTVSPTWCPVSRGVLLGGCLGGVLGRRVPCRLGLLSGKCFVWPVASWEGSCGARDVTGAKPEQSLTEQSLTEQNLTQRQARVAAGPQVLAEMSTLTSSKTRCGRRGVKPGFSPGLAEPGLLARRDEGVFGGWRWQRWKVPHTGCAAPVPQPVWFPKLAVGLVSSNRHHSPPSEILIKGVVIAFICM